MPRWLILHTKDAFTLEDKERLSQGMANIYKTFGLPGFFAHVQFIDLGEGNFWSGGVQPDHPSATISIFHAAANVRTPQEGENFLKAVDDVVRPVLRPKGIRWESNVYETSRDLWRLQGMAVPDFGTDLLAKWVKDETFTDQEEEQLLRQQGYLDSTRWTMPKY